MHREREGVPRGHPVHVTLRMRRDVPSLRSRRWLCAFRETLSRGCERGGFRVVHYSVQRDHIHLIVEAAGKQALASGMKSIGARIALSVNRVFGRRGPVLDGRFHSVVLATPRQVRNALRYVLLNHRKHANQRGVRVRTADQPDEASSGRVFDGWRAWGRPRGSSGEIEVARARSWLLSTGWRRHGLIPLSDVHG